jgi:hypothetical protein
MNIDQRHREFVQRQLLHSEEKLNDEMELVFRGWVKSYADVAQEAEFQKQCIRDAHFLLR